MSALLLILLSAVLVGHYAPAVAGWRPFETTDPFDNASGFATASAIVMVLAAPLGYLLEHWVLVPWQLQHLRWFVLVMVVVLLARLVFVGLRRSDRWQPLPQLVPLLVVNCALLGTTLFVVSRAESFGSALLAGVATASGYGVILLSFTALLQRLRHANVPGPFQGAPLALITVGLMALACMGLTGLVRD